MNSHAKINRRQIGLVHVAKAQLMGAGVLTEESYRDLLAQFQQSDGKPVTSSTELNNEQCDALMEHFAKCGFVYQPSAASRQRPGKTGISRLTAAKQIHMAAIGAILDAIGKPWAYADAIARQMFGIQKLEWLSAERLHKVHQALIYQERRRAGNPVQRRKKRQSAASRQPPATKN